MKWTREGEWKVTVHEKWSRKGWGGGEGRVDVTVTCNHIHNNDDVFALIKLSTHIPTCDPQKGIANYLPRAHILTDNPQSIQRGVRSDGEDRGVSAITSSNHSCTQVWTTCTTQVIIT